jgi:hypothetical protein
MEVSWRNFSYNRIHPIKSLTSGAGNVIEPMLISQVRREPQWGVCSVSCRVVGPSGAYAVYRVGW